MDTVCPLGMSGGPWMIGELDGTSFVNDKAFANGCQSSTSKKFLFPAFTCLFSWEKTTTLHFK